MKTKLIGMAVVLVSFAMVVGGYAASSPDAERTPSEPSEDVPEYMLVEDGDDVYVEAGKFTIGIEGNITTGYSWVLPEDSELVPVDTSYVNSDTTLVGAPGTFLFTFDAEPGEYDLEFQYLRSWVPDEVLETATVHIVVL